MITIEVKVADPPADLEYTGEYRRAEREEQSMLNGKYYAGLTCGYALILRKIVPLWVPPKGVFMPGWLTRDEGDTVFWWSAEEAEYDRSQESWITYGLSMLLHATHPDSLPPLEIPAHLSKFRVE